MNCYICGQEFKSRDEEEQHRHLCSICFGVDRGSESALLQLCRSGCGTSMLTDADWTSVFLESQEAHLSRFSRFVFTNGITLRRFVACPLKSVIEDMNRVDPDCLDGYYAWVTKLHNKLQPRTEGRVIHQFSPVRPKSDKRPLRDSLHRPIDSLQWISTKTHVELRDKSPTRKAEN